MSDHGPWFTGALIEYTHPDPFAASELCGACRSQDASHKVEESTSDARQAFTNYLCCGCFGQVMGVRAIRMCARANTEGSY